MLKHKTEDLSFQIERWLDVPLKKSLVFVSIVSFLCYCNTLNAGFVYDDTRAILKNEDLRPKYPISNIFYNDFWGTPLSHSGSHKSYRPLCVLTFRLNYMLGELNPFGYHLINVLLHCVVSCLFTIYCYKIFHKEWLSFLGGLFFAVHPIHTEAVAGVVGRADVGSAVFFLLSLICYHNATSKLQQEKNNKLWFLFSLLFAMFSMYTKEQGVTVLGVIVAYEMLMISKCNFALPSTVLKTLHKSGGLIRIVFVIIYTFLTLYTRFLVMGHSPPSFSPADNPAANHDDALTRFLTFMYLPAVNLWLLVFPLNLSYDYSMHTIPLVESLFRLELLFTVFLYGGLLFIAYLYLKYSYLQINNDENITKLTHKQLNQQNGKTKKKQNTKTTPKQQQQQQQQQSLQQEINKEENITLNSYNIFILSLALMILPFLPATNLFFYVGFVIAERILYIPSIGYCMLVINGLNILVMKYKAKHKQIAMMFATILFIFAAKTHDRNFVWENEEALYRSGLKVSPAKSYANLANVYVSQNKTKEAEQAYRSALKYRGNMADTHYNLGILLQKMKRMDEAVESYKNAIVCRPRLAAAHLNLGFTLKSMGKLEEALEVFKKAYNISDHGLKDPATHATSLTNIRYNAGVTLFELKRFNESIEIFLDALKKMPDNYEPHSIYNMIGQAYASQNMRMYAESWFVRALSAKSDHIPALLAYANLLKDSHEEPGDIEKAEEHFKEALKIDPSREDSHLLYGTFLLNSKRVKKGISVLTDFLKKDPQNLQALNILSTHYRETKDYETAIKYQLIASKAHSRKSEVLMNLGALYHLIKDYDKASQTYEKALELQPNNQLLIDNMKKLERIKAKTGKSA